MQPAWSQSCKRYISHTCIAFPITSYRKITTLIAFIYSLEIFDGRSLEDFVCR